MAVLFVVAVATQRQSSKEGCLAQPEDSEASELCFEDGLGTGITGPSAGSAIVQMLFQTGGIRSDVSFLSFNHEHSGDWFEKKKS